MAKEAVIVNGHVPLCDQALGVSVLGELAQGFTLDQQVADARVLLGQQRAQFRHFRVLSCQQLHQALTLGLLDFGRVVVFRRAREGRRALPGRRRGDVE